MKIQAGWVTDYDTKGRPEAGVTEYDSVQDALAAHPEVFGEDTQPSLREIYDMVDFVNCEGNYHEFLFRIVEVV